jgi:hypothetical protein
MEERKRKQEKKEEIMVKVKQFIQLKDESGVLKNLSELLQEVRNRNIKTIFLCFERSDGSIRTFWHGDNIAELNLVLDQMKHDLIDNRFEDFDSQSYKS